jgi:hypothetical protein
VQNGGQLSKLQSRHGPSTKPHFRQWVLAVAAVQLATLGLHRNVNSLPSTGNPLLHHNKLGFPSRKLLLLLPLLLLLLLRLLRLLLLLRLPLLRNKPVCLSSSVPVSLLLALITGWPTRNPSPWKCSSPCSSGTK